MHQALCVQTWTGGAEGQAEAATLARSWVNAMASLAARPDTSPPSALNPCWNRADCHVKLVAHPQRHHLALQAINPRLALRRPF